jgi:hypothetical protein
MNGGQVRRVGTRRREANRLFVDDVDPRRLLILGREEEGSVRCAIRINAGGLPFNIEFNVRRRDQSTAFGGELIPVARAIVDGEDVRLIIRDLR